MLTCCPPAPDPCAPTRNAGTTEEQVGIREATEWSRHFSSLELDMDSLLIRLFGIAEDSDSASLIRKWCDEHRYVTGCELAEAGLAELIDLSPLEWLRQ